VDKLTWNSSFERSTASQRFSQKNIWFYFIRDPKEQSPLTDEHYS